MIRLPTSTCSKFSTLYQLYSVRYNSTNPASTILTRDFIYSALYHSDTGYFTNIELPVITQPSISLNFTNFFGKQEYQYQLQQIYKASRNGWLTPVEIFAPWYSYAIATYIIQHHLHRIKQNKLSLQSTPLIIYEIGGGNGTHAKHVLDYIKDKVPHIYRTMYYKILEVSANLQQIQTKTLLQHQSIAQSIHMDGMFIHKKLHDTRYSYIIALEVLDNLPHDKIVAINTDGSKVLENQSSWCEQQPLSTPKAVSTTISDQYSNSIYETYVESLSPTEASMPIISNNINNLPRLKYREVYKPLQDKLINEVYQYWLMYQKNNSSLSLSTSLSKANISSILLSNPLVQALDKEDIPITSIEKFMKWINKTIFKHSINNLLPLGYQYGRYLPTGCYQFLQSIHQAFPSHSLILADFTYLPPPHVLQKTIEMDSEILMYAPGTNQPIVASKIRNSSSTTSSADTITRK